MKNFTFRHTETKEIIDDFNFNGFELEQNLTELTYFNKALGGYRANHSAIGKFIPKSGEPITVLDIGCGSADTLLEADKRFNSKLIRVKFTGIDVNQNIVNIAVKITQHSPQIEIKQGNVFNGAFPKRTFDIISASLFFHHFTSVEIVAFLRQLKQKAKMSIVISDLHRHPVSYYGFVVISKILRASRVTKHDGKISILKGFTKSEWVEILHKAGINNYEIKWKWAFRHQIIVFCENK